MLLITLVTETKKVFRILIADDDRLFRQSFRRRLQRHLDSYVFAVDEVASGEDAMMLIKRGQVDLLVLDYDMSPMNGLQVLSRIKQEKYRISIIGVSAHLKILATMKEQGAGEVFWKKCPAQLSECLNSVRALIADNQLSP